MREITIILAIYSILLRLAELIISKRNQNKLSKRDFHLTENTLVFLAMVSVHTIFYFSLFLELYFTKRNFDLVPQLALFVFISSQLLRYWTLRALGTNWNVNIMSPKDFKNSYFVSSGPYHFIRHPNYLVVILEFLSLPLIGSAIYTALIFSFLNALVLFFRINEEESFLFKRPAYYELMNSKKRFIPGVF